MLNRDPIADAKSIIDFDTATYRGANPEYIVYKGSGEPLSFTEYQENVLPIINQSFPEITPELTNPCQAELDNNEALCIKTMLEKKGYHVLVIPKVLYDLMYVYFRYHELYEHHSPYLKKYYEARINTDIKYVIAEKEKHVTPIDNWLGSATETPKVQEKVLSQDQFAEFLKEEKVSLQVPILNVSFEGVFKDYQNRENNLLYQKAEYSFNNQVLQYFKEMRINLKVSPLYLRELTINDMLTMANDIFEKLYKKNDDKFMSVDRDAFNLKRRLLDPSMKDVVKKIILEVLLHEFSLDPAYYTLYRTKQFKRNSLIESISFGQSVLSGIEYDNLSGSPLTIKLQNPERHVYYLDVKKSDYHNPKTAASNLLFIPPARRINRTIGTGEFWHVRSKFPIDPKTTIDGIYGFSYEIRRGLENKPHPLKMDGRKIKNEADYKKYLAPYIERNLLELPSIKDYSFFSNSSCTKTADHQEGEELRVSSPAAGSGTRCG